MVPNVGMFASWDPVALDQAIADAICAQPAVPNSMLSDRDPGGADHLHAVNPDSDWEICLAHAEEIGVGTRAYELVEVA